MSEHTPGPWWVTQFNGETVVEAKRNGKNAWIATHLYDEDNEPTLKELAANAHLIATAPTLLDALREAAGQLETAASDMQELELSSVAAMYQRWADKAAAVIAKAESLE